MEPLAHYVPALVTENPQAVDELVSAVGGLPLALTLLGHYLAAQALSGQPRRLQTALQRLREWQHRLQLSMPVASNERSPVSSSQTPLSLYTAIALSAQLLEAQAFRVFCALSVFPAKPASFSEEACNGYLGHPFKNLPIENENDPPSLLANIERWVYNHTSSTACSCSIDDTLT